MSKLTDLVSREPVRVYLYGVAVAVIALLGVTGVLSAGLVPVILSLVGTVLAVEKARSLVTPVPTLLKYDPPQE